MLLLRAGLRLRMRWKVVDGGIDCFEQKGINLVVSPPIQRGEYLEVAEPEQPSLEIPSERSPWFFGGIARERAECSQYFRWRGGCSRREEYVRFTWL